MAKEQPSLTHGHITTHSWPFSNYEIYCENSWINSIIDNYLSLAGAISLEDPTVSFTWYKNVLNFIWMQCMKIKPFVLISMGVFHLNPAPTSSFLACMLLFWCALLVTSEVGTNNKTDRPVGIAWLQSQDTWRPFWNCELLEWQPPFLSMARGYLWSTTSDSEGYYFGPMIAQTGRFRITTHWKFKFFVKANPPRQ